MKTHLVLLADELVEIVDGLLELLVQQARHAAAVIGARQVGAQLDRLAEVLQSVVVVAQARAPVMGVRCRPACRRD